MRKKMKGHHELGPKGKKLLRREEEFGILKLVLDKFLWLAVIVIAYGLYKFYEGIADSMIRNISILVTGAIILVLFAILLKIEYEIIG